MARNFLKVDSKCLFVYLHKGCRFDSSKQCTNVRKTTSQSECTTNKQIRIHKMQTNRDNFRYEAVTHLLDYPSYDT